MFQVENQSTPSSTRRPLLLGGLFDDTLRMLVEAHHYFRHYGPQDQQALPAEGRLAYAAEMTRITLRLSAVMAWAMARRAVHSGEVEENSPLQDYALSFRESCLQDSHTLAWALPAPVADLLARSKSLYERAARLDDGRRAA